MKGIILALSTLALGGSTYAIGGGHSSVCDRTPVVRDAIVKKLGSRCESISPGMLSRLEDLSVSPPTPHTVKSIVRQDFEGLDSLVELNISSVEDLPSDLFDDLKSLRRVGISYVKILPEGIFQSLSQLSGLSLGPIFEVPSENLFHGLRNLKMLQLDLRGIRNSALPDELFLGLRSLEELSMRGGYRITFPEALLLGLRLKRLTVSYSLIEGDLFPSLASMSNTLEYLDLRGNGARNASFPDMIAGLRRLKALYLCGNSISEMDRGAIFQTFPHGGRTYLDLYETNCR